MTIDEAIDELKRAKKAGKRSGVFAWWFAEDFEREDSPEWEADAAFIEDEMDWSNTVDHIWDLLDEPRV